MRVLFLLSVLVVLGRTTVMASPQTLLVSQSAPLDNVANCRLDIGWTYWKPFQYLSDENQAAGLTIDQLDLVAKEMQCQFIYHQYDWVTSIQMNKSGKLD